MCSSQVRHHYMKSSVYTFCDAEGYHVCEDCELENAQAFVCVQYLDESSETKRWIGANMKLYDDEWILLDVDWNELRGGPTAHRIRIDYSVHDEREWYSSLDTFRFERVAYKSRKCKSLFANDAASFFQFRPQFQNYVDSMYTRFPKNHPFDLGAIVIAKAEKILTCVLDAHPSKDLLKWNNLRIAFPMSERDDPEEDGYNTLVDSLAYTVFAYLNNALFVGTRASVVFHKLIFETNSVRLVDFGDAHYFMESSRAPDQKFKGWTPSICFVTAVDAIGSNCKHRFLSDSPIFLSTTKCD